MARTRRRPEQNPEPEVVDDPDALEAAEAEVAELDADQDPEPDARKDSGAFDGFDEDIAPRRSASTRPVEPRGRSRRARAAATDAAGVSAEDHSTSAKGSKASNGSRDATGPEDSTSPKPSTDRKDPRAARAARSSRRTSIEVPDAAKDASAARSARARSSAEAQRARTDRRRVAAVAPNPAWLAPTAVGLLIAGLVYLVTYYLSAAALPLPIGDWNILVGFGIMIAGGGLLMRWK